MASCRGSIIAKRGDGRRRLFFPSLQLSGTRWPSAYVELSAADERWRFGLTRSFSGEGGITMGSVTSWTHEKTLATPTHRLCGPSVAEKPC